jgi:hypothetical protein
MQRAGKWISCGALALAFGAALCGCARHAARPQDPSTQVAYRTIEAPDTRHYDVAPEESANVPVPLANPAPGYPPELVALRLAHVSVRAKLIVDTQGHVAEVRFDPAQGASHPAAFDEAVRSAVARWRYVPLRFREWRDVLDAQGNVVDAEPVKDEVKPFSLDYEFTFDLRNGKPVVATKPAGAN